MIGESPMTFQQLKYIVEISKCGSISQAAENLLIAQPSLSKTIQELEKELGCTLLKRSRRGVVFTAEGIEFLQYATRILGEAEAVKERFAPQVQEHKVKLSVASQHYAVVSKAFAEFASRCESRPYSLSLHEGRTSQVISSVVTQKCSLGIIGIAATNRSFMRKLFKQNNLAFSPLFTCPLRVYIHPRHPLAGKEELTLEDLNPYPCIQYMQGRDSHYYNEEYVGPQKPDKTIYASDKGTVRFLVEHTKAYLIGTGMSLSSAVVTLPLRTAMEPVTVGYIRLKHLPVAPEIETYIDLLKQIVAEDQRRAGFP